MSGRGRRAVAGLAAALMLLGAALPLAACGAADDPFTGLWREPATARRIEIRKDGDKYWLYYGADKQAFSAIRDGDELRIRQPMGADIVVRPGSADGTLEMITDGKTTLLKALPEHQ